jgi:hypothetical protein
MKQIWEMLKKHQMEACSKRLGVMYAASSGPVAQRKMPCTTMFVLSTRKGMNIRKLWMAALGLWQNPGSGDTKKTQKREEIK